MSKSNLYKYVRLKVDFATFETVEFVSPGEEYDLRHKIVHFSG